MVFVQAHMEFTGLQVLRVLAPSTFYSNMIITLASRKHGSPSSVPNMVTPTALSACVSAFVFVYFWASCVGCWIYMSHYTNYSLQNPQERFDCIYLLVGELLCGVESGLSPGWSFYVDDHLEHVQPGRHNPRHRYNLTVREMCISLEQWEFLMIYYKIGPYGPGLHFDILTNTHKIT